MPTSITASALPNQIQQLLAQRQQHADAISKIDKTLAGVIAALGGTAKPATLPHVNLCRQLSAQVDSTPG